MKDCRFLLPNLRTGGRTMIIIYAATADKQPANKELEELVEAHDRSLSISERERLAERIFPLVEPTIRGLIIRANQGRPIGDEELHSLAWQVLARGLNETGVSRLKRSDGNWRALVEQCKLGRPAGARVWNMLSAELRNELSSTVYLKSTLEDRLVRELNAVIRRRDLYDPEAFPDSMLLPEARELVSKGVASLPMSDLSRLNVLLLASSKLGINAPPKPPRNLMGLIKATIIPQMKPAIWEAASGRQVDRYAVETLNALKPDIQAVKEMEATGTLPPEGELLNEFQRISEHQKRRLSRQYGPALKWLNERVKELQPQNFYAVNDVGSLRSARELLAQHSDKCPESLWKNKGAPYYVPAHAMKPIGAKAIERAMGTSQPLMESSRPQAVNAQEPISEMDPSLLGPHAYRAVAEKLFGKPGFEVERSMALFMATTPRPTPQQAEMFIASLPPELGETIRDVGFKNIVREVDQKILKELSEPETQEWLSKMLGQRPRAVQMALVSVRRAVFARRADFDYTPSRQYTLIIAAS
jgi:hypothetical protein